MLAALLWIVKWLGWAGVARVMGRECQTSPAVAAPCQLSACVPRKWSFRKKQPASLAFGYSLCLKLLIINTLIIMGIKTLIIHPKFLNRQMMRILTWRNLWSKQKRPPNCRKQTSSATPQLWLPCRTWLRRGRQTPAYQSSVQTGNHFL